MGPLSTHVGTPYKSRTKLAGPQLSAQMQAPLGPIWGCWLGSSPSNKLFDWFSCSLASYSFKIASPTIFILDFKWHVLLKDIFCWKSKYFQYIVFQYNGPWGQQPHWAAAPSNRRHGCWTGDLDILAGDEDHFESPVTSACWMGVTEEETELHQNCTPSILVNNELDRSQTAQRPALGNNAG